LFDTCLEHSWLFIHRFHQSWPQALQRLQHPNDRCEAGSIATDHLAFVRLAFADQQVGQFRAPCEGGME
jgi:hypothetical protein